MASVFVPSYEYGGSGTTLFVRLVFFGVRPSGESDPG